MEELDLLKKHWNKEQDFPKVNKEEIRLMIHKNSSSILKWILLICLLEFTLGLSLKAYYFIYDTEKMKSYDIVFEIIGTIATGYFLLLFFKEYSRIKTFTNTKSLMNSILKARSWVKMYISITLGIIILQCAFGAFDLSIFNAFQKGYREGSHQESALALSNTMITILMIITFSIIAILLLLYYRMVYIRLIKKLKKNYDDLIDLES